jgi:hypothetical protein
VPLKLYSKPRLTLSEYKGSEFISRRLLEIVNSSASKLKFKPKSAVAVAWSWFRVITSSLSSKEAVKPTSLLTCVLSEFLVIVSCVPLKLAVNDKSLSLLHVMPSFSCHCSVEGSEGFHRNGRIGPVAPDKSEIKLQPPPISLGPSS